MLEWIGKLGTGLNRWNVYAESGGIKKFTSMRWKEKKDECRLCMRLNDVSKKVCSTMTLSESDVHRE